MKNTTVFLGIALLLIGLGSGYAIGSMRRNEQSAPVASMPGMMMDMNAGLRGKTGDDFDKTFIDEMTIHHQGAIDMANLVLTTSKRPELLELAHNIIAAQSSEIAMMKQWRDAWFK
jgi:uncharacterized protein (DUF305 family)